MSRPRWSNPGGTVDGMYRNLAEDAPNGSGNVGTHPSMDCEECDDGEDDCDCDDY